MVVCRRDRWRLPTTGNTCAEAERQRPATWPSPPDWMLGECGDESARGAPASHSNHSGSAEPR